MRMLTAQQVKLGFIGIGAMGSRMARRLLDHGYNLAVYDRNHGKAEGMLPYGASIAEDLVELASGADVILSCLTDDEAVQSVYTGPKGLMAVAPRGTVVLEASTVSPKTSRALHALGADRGIEVMDVAISGSTPAVERGTLVLLVGGNAEVFQAAEPIFRALAVRHFLMGPSGSGTAMKLVVNTLLGVGMQAIAEAVALGEGGGLDRKKLLEVLAQTAVVAPAHVGKLATAEREDYSPQFAVGLMNKDFRLILETASALSRPMPTTTAAFQVNSEALKADPEADFSSVIRQMEKFAAAPVSS
jgi:3-hydroxyisobutyrate dehydrogenase-like beta-hydroxyacid dehydrogenase